MTVDYTSQTFVVMLVEIIEGREMTTSFFNSHSIADVFSSNGAAAFAAPKIGFFLRRILAKKTERGIVVGKTVFGYWRRSERRNQSPIGTAACALVMMPGKGEMF